MMQLIQKDNAPQVNYVNLNLYDLHNGAVTMDQGFRPLISIKSQQTGSVKSFMPVSILLTKKERYVEMMIINADYDSLSLGVIEIGNDDFPYGFYDTTIYANSSDSNLKATVNRNDGEHLGFIGITVCGILPSKITILPGLTSTVVLIFPSLS